MSANCFGEHLERDDTKWPQTPEKSRAGKAATTGPKESFNEATAAEQHEQEEAACRNAVVLQAPMALKGPLHFKKSVLS